MVTPRILQQQLLDLIRTSIDGDREVPSDDAIAARFNLRGIEAARSLLADLADQGAITITGFGPTRRITLGRNTVQPKPAPRPIPAVVKRTAGARDGSIDAGLAKISQILARGRTAVAPDTKRAAPRKPISVSPKTSPGPKPCDAVGEGAQQGSSLARVAAPHPIIGMEMPRRPVTAPVADATPPKQPGKTRGRDAESRAAPIAPRSERRQLNIHFPSDAFAKLEDRAAVAGVSPTRHARDVMIAHLDDRLPSPNSRTIIPASLAAAAIRDGFPVVEFAQRMMALGLAAYSHEMVMA